MTRGNAVYSSFPRSAKAHAMKYNIRRKQCDFSEVTEKWKSYSLSLDSFTQGSRAVILFPSSPHQTVLQNGDNRKNKRTHTSLNASQEVGRFD